MGRLRLITSEASRLIETQEAADEIPGPPRDLKAPPSGTAAERGDVGTARSPYPVLLEHESLRDRLILEAGHDKRSYCWCFVFGCWLTVRQHGFHMARLLVWGASLNVALRKQHISSQEIDMKGNGQTGITAAAELHARRWKENRSYFMLHGISRGVGPPSWWLRRRACGGSDLHWSGMTAMRKNYPRPPSWQTSAGATAGYAYFHTERAGDTRTLRVAASA